MKKTKPSTPPVLPLCRNALVPDPIFEMPKGPAIPFAYATVSVNGERPEIHRVALIRDLESEELARWKSQATDGLTVCICPIRLRVHAEELDGDAPHESWRPVDVDVAFDLSSVDRWSLGFGLSIIEWLSICVHAVSRDSSQRKHIKDPYLYFEVSRALNLPMPKKQLTQLSTTATRMLETSIERFKTADLTFNEILRNLDYQLSVRMATQQLCNSLRPETPSANWYTLP